MLCRASHLISRCTAPLRRISPKKPPTRVTSSSSFRSSSRNQHDLVSLDAERLLGAGRADWRGCASPERPLAACAAAAGLLRIPKVRVCKDGESKARGHRGCCCRRRRRSQVAASCVPPPLDATRAPPPPRLPTGRPTRSTLVWLAGWCIKQPGERSAPPAGTLAAWRSATLFRTQTVPGEHAASGFNAHRWCVVSCQWVQCFGCANAREAAGGTSTHDCRLCQRDAGGLLGVAQACGWSIPQSVCSASASVSTGCLWLDRCKALQRKRTATSACRSPRCPPRVPSPAATSPPAAFSSTLHRWMLPHRYDSMLSHPGIG